MSKFVHRRSKLIDEPLFFHHEKNKCFIFRIYCNLVGILLLELSLRDIYKLGDELSVESNFLYQFDNVEIIGKLSTGIEKVIWVRNDRWPTCWLRKE